MKNRFVFFAVLLLTLTAVLNGVSCDEGQQGATVRSEGGGEAQGRHLGGILGSLIGGAAYGYGYPGQYGYGGYPPSYGGYHGFVPHSAYGGYGYQPFGYGGFGGYAPYGYNGPYYG